MICKGFADFLKRLRKRYGPSTAEADKLRQIIRASLSEKAYKKACIERCERDGDENFRRYQEEWLACLLAHIRPGLIDPKRLSAYEWEHVSRIVRAFQGMGRNLQRKVIRQLFISDLGLRDIGIAKRDPRTIPSRATLEAVRKVLDHQPPLRGLKRALALDLGGADYWKPSAAEVYRNDPDRIRKNLSHWRELGLLKRPARI